MGHNSADYLHVYTEAKRIAFADRAAYLADPSHVPPGSSGDARSRNPMPPTVARRSMSRRAAEYVRTSRSGGSRSGDRRRSRCPPQRHSAGDRRGDTVYLAAADRFGNAISLINSLFDSFGSGIVVPGTGIALHSRGSGFTLQPGHPNRLAPGKRPFHTLVPAFLMSDGQTVHGVRSDGRGQPGPGARADRRQHRGLRDERAGSGRRGACAALRRRPRGRIRHPGGGARCAPCAADMRCTTDAA